MMDREKILFVYAGMSSFIQRDLDLLKKHFDVRAIDFIFTKKNLKGTIVSIFEIARGVLWADLTYSWFASTNAYYTVKFSKLFKKKSIVIVGGFEVAKVPEIEYGLLLESAKMVRYIFENADILLTVDEGLRENAIRNLELTGENIQTVHLGFDSDRFTPLGRKDKLVLTVASGDGLERIPLKGLDTFVKAAEFLPDVKFVVIGIQGYALRELKKIAPPNVKFIDSLPGTNLIQYYRQTKVYCQLSMREGHPCALSEAMLCECVPVGSNVQGVRTVIGDAGFLVPYGDIKTTADAIKKALNSDNGGAARNRVKNLFSVENRTNQLNNVINKLLI